MNKILLRRFIWIVLLSSLAGALQAQGTRYVKQGATGDGSNWANASGDLQSMMNAAANGGTVYVAGGTYYPTTSTDRNITFLLPKAGNIKIFGGYNAATGIRNITANPTILSGDIGTTGDDADNSYHVLVIANTDVNADSIIIDGFTVTKGRTAVSGLPFNYNAVGISPQYGGGICVVVGGKVAIRNTIISNNKASFGGGGMFNHYSSPLIEDCSIVSNESIDDYNYYAYQYYGGGGIYNKYSDPQFTRTSIKLNKGFRGAGMLNYAGSSKFNNCLFDGNVAGDKGGATYNFSPASYEQSLPVFTNCVFTNNKAGLGGVGYDTYKSSPTYTNCVFYSNSALGSSGYGYGGCFYGYESEFLTINNCVFSGNVTSEDETIRLINSSIRIRNSIIHGNSGGTDIYIAGPSSNSEIGNSLIGSVGTTGGVTINYLTGNLIGSYNPQFTNAANAVGADGIWGTADDGLQLKSISPVINAGSNSLVPGGITTDITGAQRIQAGTVDMGPYESAIIINCASSTLYVDGTRASSGQGNSWSTAFKTLNEAMERAGYCSNVNTIMVAKGTYYATGDQNGTNRDSAFLIPQRGGIKIVGGYPNGGGTRNINTYPTILSGDIGVTGNNSDNSYHILVMTGTTAGADSVVIDGFTITGANANGGNYYYNNVLTNQNEGGGVLFRSNTNAGTKIAIRNCNILNNNANIWGAGIYTLESSAFISNCVIANNTANEGGGGFFSYGTSSPYLVNCVLSGNSAKNGAAVYNSGSSPTIINSTFSGNTASQQGSGIYNTGSASTNVVNTILWNNGINNISNSATLNITYSNVEQGSGIYSGTGNINIDPLFVNSLNAAGSDNNWRTVDDGLKLQAGSPAINTGTPDVTALSINPFDLQESARLLAGRIDMGAYESPFINCSQSTNILYVDGSVSQSGNGTSWANAFKTLSEALTALNGCPNINTIFIAKGTYYPSASSNRDDAFIIPQRGDVKLYGGYPTGGGTRDVLANPVILSGDIGAANNNTDNSYHVMVITNTNASADSIIIDGFTFANANANGSGSNRTTGGGLLLLNTGNNSKIAIRNCRFENNRAAQGAGIYISASSPRIINSFVQGNFSTDNGGGISNYNAATPTLVNVVISGNQASFAGAVFNDNSSPTFINATIADNYASGDAGGFYNRYTGTNVNFVNSIIYGNRRPDGSASNIFNTSGGKATIAYSLIESTTGAWDPAFGVNNGNNLFSDPLFVARVNPTSGNTPNTSGNYQLQSASPVIDAGDNASILPDISTDIVNAMRLQHAWVDMGAFESPYFNCGLFTADTAQTNVTCYGNATGIASVSLNRGEAPYTYNWSNGATTAAINNIVAGGYTCSITDANGCSIAKQIIITQPLAPLAATGTQTNIVCYNGSTGSATIAVSGGTAPYTYSWSNGGTASTINNVTAGTYTCTVTDANGCLVVTPITITQPAALAATTSQTNVLCYNGNSGSATITVSGGIAPYTYNWSNGETASTTNNLAVGNYSCTVTDANGCSVVISCTITQPVAALAITTSQTNVLCYNGQSGSATVTVSGGTAPYTYNWSNGGTTSTINNLADGNYTCTVTDANGCVRSEAVTITEPIELTVQVIAKTDVYCGGGNKGMATIKVNGGVAPYVYLWANGSNLPVVNALASGNHSCVITDVNGCTLNTSVNIAQKTFSGNKIYVDSAVAVSGDGSSWGGAFRYLSDAMVAAACPNVDSILVAKGTYYPTGTQAGANRDSTFLIRQTGGLKMFGGYPSGGGIRDMGANATILSGDIGSTAETDNSYHVIVIAGIASGADSVVIDGFVIQRGNGSALGVHFYNGIEVGRLYGSGINLSNNNDAGGKISIRNCQFTRNVASYTGGAIYNQLSSPVITRCKFLENSGGNGGAICNEPLSNPQITICEFLNNESGDYGGAIFNSPNSHAIIDQCRFLSNISTFGGAIGNESSSPVITNCYIAGNMANYGGAGIYNNNASPQIINTYFIGNKAWGASSYGGGLSNVNNSIVTVTNCTFSGNDGWASSGTIYNDASQVSLINCIAYGNYSGIQNINAATTTVKYSLLEYWTGGGTGNLNGSINPLFVAWGSGTPPFTNGDYRLRACSPAINAGTVDTTGLNLPAFATAPEWPRVQLGRIDMGAHEANSYTNASTGAIPETLTTTAAFQLSDSTTWYATGCDSLIAAITGSGSNPVSGNTVVTVSKDAALLPGTVTRFYEIIPDNNPGSASGTITLYYTQAEFTAYNLANSIKLPLPDKDDPQMNDKIPNIRIRKVSGTVQTTIIPQTVTWNNGAQRWELTFNVTGFSKFYVFTEIDAALPLRLINFEAKEDNCIANISWTTAVEEAVSHFELQYSSDGTSWLTSSQIKARNTTGENKYNTSVNIHAAVNFYRLKMVDINGETSYSKIVKLISPLSCVGQAIRLYPNPGRETVYIENAHAGDIYNIYDNTGRLVLQGIVKKAIQEVDVRKLIPGIYAISIVNRKEALQIMKFIKQ